MSSSLYPTSPTSIDKKLTALTSSYKLKVTLAIISIALFFILYAALVTATGILAYYAFIYEINHVHKGTVLMKIGAMAGSVMLFVFTLKFLFKLKNHKPNNRYKLKKENNPELWDFIHQICKETGAPKPKNIYVDPDVNAYVAYSNTWLSLFLPVRKELTIGLGLVSCINLSEFKAVISHEFGHFAQRSMKVGSYIITANTIIHDMIYSRDKWDETLAQWRSADLRLSFAAWIVTPIIWIIRQFLALFYQFLNIMYSSLSREMEFNADKVAVSVSGSDAIISALWKLESGNEQWNSTVNNAYLASQKNIYAENLYAHNELALERISTKVNEAIASLPVDERGGKKYFSSSEQSKVSMYASHPPNDKREANAKVPYIECIIDIRSPWLLFREKENIQKVITKLIYEQYLNKKPGQATEPAEFEKFIAIESAGKNLQEEYLNTFENRFLNIPSDEELTSGKLSLEQIPSAKATLHEELKGLMAPVQEIEKLMQKAQEIANGTTKEKFIEYKGQSYRKRSLEQGFIRMMEDREFIFNNKFNDWDKSFCLFYISLATQTGKDQELLKIYNQHRVISHFYKNVTGTKNRIIESINALQARNDVTQTEISVLSREISSMMRKLNQIVTKISVMGFIPLPNIDTTDELKIALIDKDTFSIPDGNLFENNGINEVMQQLETSTMLCQRVEQKSIGAILSFHSELNK